MIDVIVERVQDEARGIRSFVLVAVGGVPLPSYEPGAHIDVALADRLVRSYSLTGPLNDGFRYRIAVNLDPRSRGGSSWLHSDVSAGDLLRISEPRNHFPLVEDAPASILIAGGIGITPIWCMVQRLQALNKPWTLHYACRSRQAAAFVDELSAAAGQGAGTLQLWFDEEHQGNPLNIAPIVHEAPVDTHLYCCGPAAMLSAFRESAAGESSGRIHFEYFRPAEIAKPTGGFVVELARSGVSVEVPAGSSILDALIMRGIDAPYSCYEGLCGTCETRVLEGIPDHKDNLLSEKAKSENNTVIICCSGSKTKRLVLDL